MTTINHFAINTRLRETREAMQDRMGDMEKISKRLKALREDGKAGGAEYTARTADHEKRVLEFEDLRRQAEELLAQLETDACSREAPSGVGPPLETRGKPSSAVEPNGRLQTLAGRVSVRNYLRAFIDGRSPDGAEGELSDELYGSRDARGAGGGLLLPWEALETRADVATSVGASVSGPTRQPNIVQRIFSRTVGAHLGVSFEQVGVGEASYPVLTAGVSPEMKAAGSAKDAQAATITANDLKPVRLAARYIYRTEDAHRVHGLDEALRGDMSRAVTEETDDAILNGNGTAPNPTGIIAALSNPTNPSAKATYSSFLNTFGEAVDGKHAAMRSELRGVLGVKAYALAGEVQANSNKGDLCAIDYLQDKTGGVRCSALIPAPSSNIETGLIYRSGGMGMDAVAPMWGLEIIEDRYTRASQGEIALTICSLWNFAVLRSAAYKRVEFKVA